MSDTTPNPQPKIRPSELAFSLVVVAGYAALFTTYRFPLYAPRSLLLIVLGAIFLGIGLYGTRLFAEPAQPILWQVVAYLAFEIALGTTIIYLSEGGAWLIMLSLVGTAVQHLPRSAAIGTCGIIWAGQTVPVILIAGPEGALGYAMGFLSAIVFVVVFSQVVTNERKIRRELAAANQKLREYAAQVEELAVVQERNRLAREIHDGLGHYLTAINIQLKAAQAVSRQDPAQAAEVLANAQTLTQEALADVRRSISALRADPSTSRPLPETLSALLADTRAAGIQAEFTLEGQPCPVSPQLEFTLYRVVQEGLTNVRKHSQASRVELCLAYGEHSVRVSLQDNGIGQLSPSAPASGFGLVGLRERVQLVGGALQVTSTPGQGFKLEVTLPI